MSVMTSGDTVASLSVVSLFWFQSRIKYLLETFDFKVVHFCPEGRILFCLFFGE